MVAHLKMNRRGLCRCAGLRSAWRRSCRRQPARLPGRTDPDEPGPGNSRDWQSDGLLL